MSTENNNNGNKRGEIENINNENMNDIKSSKKEGKSKKDINKNIEQKEIKDNKNT